MRDASVSRSLVMIFRSFEYPTAWISASNDSQRITLVDESCLAIGASLRAISSGLMATISYAVLFSILTNSQCFPWNYG